VLLDLVQSGKIYDEPLVLHDRYKEAQSKSGATAPDPDASPSVAVVCQAITRKGTACKNKVLSGSDYCSVHQQMAEQDTQLRDVAQIMRDLTR